MDRKERVRKTILDESKKLFIRKGYNGMSFRDLAKETGLSLGTPYSYFKGGKEEIFKECINGVELTFEGACEQPLEFTMLLEKTLGEKGGIISKMYTMDPEILFSLV